MTDIGPVQMLAIGFGPDADFKGGILNELERLEGNGLIRVLDLLFVAQEGDQLVALDYQGDELGALIGGMLGFAFVGTTTEPVVVTAEPGRESVGMSRTHLEEIISAAPPDMAVGLLMIEHVWARNLKRAIRDAGGTPLAEGFLAADALVDIQAELMETVRIIEELELEANGA